MMYVKNRCISFFSSFLCVEVSKHARKDSSFQQIGWVWYYRAKETKTNRGGSPCHFFFVLYIFLHHSELKSSFHLLMMMMVMVNDGRCPLIVLFGIPMLQKQKNQNQYLSGGIGADRLAPWFFVQFTLWWWTERQGLARWEPWSKPSWGNANPEKNEGTWGENGDERLCVYFPRQKWKAWTLTSFFLGCQESSQRQLRPWTDSYIYVTVERARFSFFLSSFLLRRLCELCRLFYQISLGQLNSRLRDCSLFLLLCHDVST